LGNHSAGADADFPRSTGGLGAFDGAGTHAWGAPNTCDDWDEVAESLFRAVVVSSLEWSIPQKGYTPLAVPRYDTEYPDYSQMNLISVRSRSSTTEGDHVFIGFSTHHSPFDVVDCFPMGANGKSVRRTRKHIAVDDAEFEFRYRMVGKPPQRLRAISVEL
jgi:hypothetical protein